MADAVKVRKCGGDINPVPASERDLLGLTTPCMNNNVPKSSWQSDPSPPFPPPPFLHMYFPIPPPPPPKEEIETREMGEKEPLLKMRETGTGISSRSLAQHGGEGGRGGMSNLILSLYLY